ncbi:MAG: glycine betaine ABC transporter substrate-binding protein [Pseudomonadota bacterium]
MTDKQDPDQNGPPRDKRRNRIPRILLAAGSVLVSAIAFAASIAELSNGGVLAGLFGTDDEEDVRPVEPITELTIGAKIHLESNVLAQMMAQVIEDQVPDIVVNMKYYLGESYLVWSELLAERVDLIPDYSGTIMSIYLDLDAPTVRRSSHDSDRLNALLKTSRSETDVQVEVLRTFGFSNSYVLLTKPETVAALGMEGDVVPLSAFSDSDRLKDLRIGSTYEFFVRDEGVRGLSDFYRTRFGDREIFEFHLEKYPAIDAGEVDVIDGYVTDAAMERGDYVVIEDDLSFWPKYWAVPITRTEVVRSRPDVVAAVDTLADQITEQEMRQLFIALDDAGVTPEDIQNGVLIDFEKTIEAFLCDQSLLKRCAPPA